MKQINLREAFSMVTAIFVIVIMASVAILVTNLSGKIVKETTAQFQREQAELYAKSYTEYAILAVTGNDRSTNCLKDIDGLIKIDTTSSTTVSNGNGYRIRVRIAYIGSSSEIGSCASTRILSTNVTTQTTPLTILVDTYVDYKDPQNSGSGSPWLTIHRRSVQKI